MMRAAVAPYWSSFTVVIFNPFSTLINCFESCTAEKGCIQFTWAKPRKRSVSWTARAGTERRRVQLLLQLLTFCLHQPPPHTHTEHTKDHPTPSPLVVWICNVAHEREKNKKAITKAEDIVFVNVGKKDKNVHVGGGGWGLSQLIYKTTSIFSGI